MSTNIGLIAVAILCAAVVAVLVLGIGKFMRNKGANPSASNKMMRWRLILQAGAVVLLILISYLAAG
ncbi:twin transmembrane helix small protein [Paracoccus sp. (in: a-proteobacteria)]|uniref:twin transmembrane helix small protein n=1 Tax=Paracoccus sp. TaxID=267 RepID=UPI0026DEAF32|nr:twin transmembrane helix small protein [Paracoccus sp. (in: a-proteobacteria)]MDO5648421.1 twin transmembrane helix small protein [Paracoccus sp. (in: a-proteobacteria)]